MTSLFALEALRALLASKSSENPLSLKELWTSFPDVDIEVYSDMGGMRGEGAHWGRNLLET